MSGSDTPKPTTPGSIACRGVPVPYAPRDAIAGLARGPECALAFRGDAISGIDLVPC